MIDAEQIDSCLLQHRYKFRQRLRNLDKRRQQGAAVDEALLRLHEQIEQSAAVAAARSQLIEAVEFPAELPITAELEQIRSLIAANQVLVLCGETGSGKSTQLPKICLSMGRGIFGRIGHTQPRRIAARSLASRISAELQQPLGQVVGYKVRFKEQVKPASRIKLMTDGMLLAEIQQDKWLNEYDTLIIDEAHERSLNIDFLLGYLRQLLPRRPDLKVIITSATIDPGRFSRFFADAPVINVSGRTFPVEVRYRPPVNEAAGERDEEMQQAIVAAVDELGRIDRGDILVFLSGEREIRETAETLRKHKMLTTEVLPLYARLSPAEQSRIFSASAARRIILATNVAETSLTVPGIRYVIDCGYARISRYSHRSKVQRLPVERISQASANQRKGRCGRVAAGVCIRLYSEDDFLNRSEFTEPEIQRTNLATVILQMKILGFGDIAKFPLVDPPDSRMIRDGYRVLHEIGAVDNAEGVTHLGKLLARLPVDPRVGRMLLEAAQNGCLREVLVIAAALAVQDPRDRPLEKQQQADEAHQEFRHESSDFLGFYLLWQHLQEKHRHLSKRKFRDYCRSRFLSPTRVQEWLDTHQQIQAQLHDMGYHENEQDADYATIHRSLLSGLLSHIGFKKQGRDREYLGARNSHFYLFPGSVLFKVQPKWLMAAELVETTRLYARTAAKIEPQWIESLSGHLLKRSYSEPHWQKKRGQVGASERVTLYGLTLAAGRKVNYGPINPEEAREIFIRFALVEGDFDSRAKFWRHNRELIDYVHDLEARSRRPDILVDLEQIYQFYDDRIPAGIYSTPQFEKWLRGAVTKQPKLLHMRLEDLMRHDAEGVSTDNFPDHLQLGSLRLPLEYSFDPERDEDGVSLVVPVALINQVSAIHSDWLVPGLLREKLIAMLKSLPKTYRKHFVPIPDFADRLLAQMQPSEQPFVQLLGATIKRMTGIHVPEDLWLDSRLDKHLRMNFKLVDAANKTIASSRDLASLQQQYADQAQQQFQHFPLAEDEISGCRDWQFGDIPETVDIERGGFRLSGFPALVDEDDSVALRVLDARPAAQHAHHQGLLRLFMLQLPQEVRYLKKNLPGLQRMRLQYAKAAKPQSGRAGNMPDLQDELLAWIFSRVFLDTDSDIRSQEQFEQRLEQGKPYLVEIANDSCRQLAEVLDLYQQLRKALSQATQINWMASIGDLQQQLDELIYQGFLQETGQQQLAAYPRYLKAMLLRLEKLRHAAARDQQQMRTMADIYQRWRKRQQAARKQGQVDMRLEEIRWMLEELRVSLYAQELKTAYPVSVKRIEKRWQELGL